MSVYYIIAGVNGAGKSTLYQTNDSLKSIPRVNTDEIVREFGHWYCPSDMLKAGKIAVKRIRTLFEARKSFNQETTLCGRSILRNIRTAKALGYHLELHYIGISSPELAKQRISYRVQHGGHDIPSDDVDRRYYESLQNLLIILPIVDLAVFYDITNHFERIAIYRNGILKLLTDDPPIWLTSLFPDLKNITIES